MSSAVSVAAYMCVVTSSYGTLRRPSVSFFTILLLWAMSDWFAISLCFIFTTLFYFSFTQFGLVNVVFNAVVLCVFICSVISLLYVCLF